MPLIEYKCKNCGLIKNKLVQSKEVKGVSSKETCPKCGAEDSLIRQLGGAASASKMVIDNGAMAKSVEVLTNIVEINQERSSKDDRNN